MCLEHLARQTLRPDSIVVVDSSPTDATHSVLHDFPDVAAFLDDDAYAAPDWLEQLVPRDADPGVGAVGGRALNGEPSQETEGADRVGLLLVDVTTEKRDEVLRRRGTQQATQARGRRRR
jgi:GT2 family glycosyltransferase